MILNRFRPKKFTKFTLQSYPAPWHRSIAFECTRYHQRSIRSRWKLLALCSMYTHLFTYHFRYIGFGNSGVAGYR